ncbi:MAG TPA: hypothetical protein DCY64_07665 [Hydrogenophaga sp.]|nr:MAG: hypothetical protein CVU21_23105 [Betaproteobacteria bacterium HGW-Betaproteobacteria-15]HAX20146.1 hypothetical protein [Hydrogenophaga sp.]
MPPPAPLRGFPPGGRHWRPGKAGSAVPWDRSRAPEQQNDSQQDTLASSGARASNPGHPWNWLCQATGCAPLRGGTRSGAGG